MAQHPDNERLCAITNELALQVAGDLIGKTNELAREHGSVAAVTITVDCALTAAIAVLSSAVLSGTVGIAKPKEQLLRDRLEFLFTLQDRLHQRLPDGSIDPVGHAVN